MMRMTKNVPGAQDNAHDGWRSRDESHNSGTQYLARVVTHGESKLLGKHAGGSRRLRVLLCGVADWHGIRPLLDHVPSSLIDRKRTHIVARQIAAWTLGTIGDYRAVELLVKRWPTTVPLTSA